MGGVINKLLVFITHGAVSHLADRREKQHFNSEEAKIGGDESQTEDNNFGDGCGNELRYLETDKFINCG